MVTQGGNYYGSLEQLDIINRLVADMDTAAESDGYTAEHRASIADVHRIIEIINANANSAN